MNGRSELRTSEQRLSGIISSAMDAVITVDEGQRIVLFNPAAEKLFGLCRRRSHWAIPWNGSFRSAAEARTPSTSCTLASRRSPTNRCRSAAKFAG